MQRFLKYCIIFSFPLFIMAFVLEVAIRQVPNPYKYKYEWMQKHAEDVEVIILGSSHTFYGIRPEFFKDKAFNLANVSQGLRQDLFLLGHWAYRYKNLKTVIYPISYYTWFSHGLEFGSESYRCRYYKIYMDSDLYPDFSLYNIELSDFRTAKGKIRKLLNPNASPGYNKYGWGTTYCLSNKKILKWKNGTEAEAAVKRHTAKEWDKIDHNYKLMKELADLCKNHRIQLVLITTPCWNTYYNHLDQGQLKKMYELTHQLQKEYGLPYFDYMKDSRFSANDFYDSNHLSDVGAIKFTQILDKDIRNLNSIEVDEISQGSDN